MSLWVAISLIMTLSDMLRASMVVARSTQTPSRATSAFSMRGMKGVYQHCAKKHLHRYATEFEFRYNNRVCQWH